MDNLKFIKGLGWVWLTRLRSNRQVDPDRTGNRAISELIFTEEEIVVHLKGYGMIKIFQIVAKNGDMEYWATNDLSMSDLTRQTLSECGWMIEIYHRDLKQTCGVERCQSRSLFFTSNSG
ncbi:hypothetical protein CCP3SC1AL1_150021 [Gammaproteobacteria bacterium]